MGTPIKLKFSKKYTLEHAQQYLHKHQDGLLRRLSHWRDEQLARKALAVASDPGLVLDLSSAAGRFWPLLAEKPNRIIIGADNSRGMLDTACKAQPAAVVERVTLLQTSAFDIDLPDHSVDCIFSMRLLHHISDAQHRLAMLKEFHRVTRDSVIVSLWVDGNYQSWHRNTLETQCSVPAGPASEASQNRFVVPRAVIEAEFKQAGFVIDERLDFLPRYAMWRVYVLRAVDGFTA
ncbi:ubiquinone/menaquinone biosynthesis C-methylase UbiE [Pseudomonas sp. TE3786]